MSHSEAIPPGGPSARFAAKLRVAKGRDAGKGALRAFLRVASGRCFGWSGWRFHPSGLSAGRATTIMVSSLSTRPKAICPAAPRDERQGRHLMSNASRDVQLPDFRGYFLMLRGRAGVTQHELAGHAGVS